MIVSPRLWLAVTGFSYVLLNASVSVGGPEQLDQFQLVTSGIGSGSAQLGVSRPVGQTFRPSVSGTLAVLELHSHINNRDTTPFQVEISIVDTVGGKPGGAVLGTILYDWPDRAGWLSFDFESQAIRLLAEHDYGIVVRSDDDLTAPITFGDEVSINWTGNSYTRGELWKYEGAGPWQSFDTLDQLGDADLAFKTFMIVPEPANVAMILLTVGHVAGLSRVRLY